MKRLVLMNSSMMPLEGTYRIRKITVEEARKLASECDKIESYIGYPRTAMYIARVLRINVVINRASVHSLSEEDTILVCRLKYRVMSPEEKRNFIPKDEDYEWYLVKYTPQQISF